MGFFTGTEPDPTVPNSKCVTYFPTLSDQFELVMSELNLTSLIPYKAIGVVDHAATLINKYALWQNYCTFGTLFTTLDNTIETFEGITAAFYRVVLNYAKVLTKVGDITTAFNQGNCFNTFKGVGEVFKIVLSFSVPEDII
jgi:hypothetical protein